MAAHDVGQALTFRGKCWKFGDNVPTDEMGEFFAQEVGNVLAGLNPRFPVEVKPGDIVVGGHSFGQSSGRALAAKVLRATGISCIVVESAARTFWRNCIEIGLPILECPGVSKLVEDGDEIVVDIEQGVVLNPATGAVARTEPPDDFLRDMLRAGGLIPFVRARPELWGA